MSVQESHRITEELARATKGISHRRVTIHTEPCDGDRVGNCRDAS